MTERKIEGPCWRDCHGNWMGLRDAGGFSSGVEFYLTRNQDEAYVGRVPRAYEAQHLTFCNAHGLSMLMAELTTTRVVEIPKGIPEDILSIEELQWKYGQHLGDSEQRQWAEHPKHPRSVWKEEVAGNVTQMNYWDWVIHAINE